MSAAQRRHTESSAREGRGLSARVRGVLPHGGSLPEEDWPGRHRLIGLLLVVMIVVVGVYAIADHGAQAIRYLPEMMSMLAFAGLAGWSGASRKWRSVSASMGLLTGSAALVDISGGLIEMHFTFFVVVVVLTLYEDWVPFLVAVAFVLIHHGVMGTIDPRAVFDEAAAQRHPWAWAGLHALFVALAGAAGVTAWGLNERVRDRMREAQRQLEVLGLTDPLTGLGNRRQLVGDVERVLEEGRPAALAIFDLDGFKEYNDRFGHPAGDALLVRVTSALRESVAGTGSAFRLGGDEFCVLADGVCRDALDLRLAEWTSCFSERGEGFAITASSGVALIPDEAADPSDALRLCDRRMYARKHSRRATAASQMRDVLVATLAASQEDLDEHASGVAGAAERVGAELGVAGVRLQELGHAADLHDIGKVAVPASILAKPAPLTDEEWELVQGHPVIGERILAAAPALAGAARIVRSTHERYDGTGYPDRLAGEQIPLEARIVTVCDAYRAMTSERPYRPAVSHPQAIDELRHCVGAQFDPAVVQAFVRVFADVPPAERLLEPLEAGVAPAAVAAV
ncbi:MAG: bifunctional diguanylate cyclase/phosphohydrolase [Solirubrobacteraceae bacterium]